MRGGDSWSFITQLAREGHFENLVRLHSSTVQSDSVYRHRMCRGVSDSWFHSMQEAIIYIDLFQLSQNSHNVDVSTLHEHVFMSMMIPAQSVVLTEKADLQ